MRMAREATEVLFLTNTAATTVFGLVDGLAACLRDERQAGKADHSSE